MKLLFIPKGQANDLMNHGIEAIQSDELDLIKRELKELDEKFQLELVNLGIETNWIFILAILDELKTAFLRDHKVDHNIDGWVKMTYLIKRIFTKSDRVYLDKDFANLLAIEVISQKFKLNSIKVTDESTILLNDLGHLFSDVQHRELCAHPYSVYITTFEVNERWLITLGIKSNGEVTELYSFDRHSQIPF